MSKCNCESSKDRIRQLESGMAEERKANSKLISQSNRLADQVSDYLAENNKLDTLLDAANSRIAELEGKLASTGCTRGQHTTQYCAEVVDRDARIAAILDLLEPDGPPIPGGLVDKENRFYFRFGRQLHARAKAIAEGQE